MNLFRFVPRRFVIGVVSFVMLSAGRSGAGLFAAGEFTFIGAVTGISSRKWLILHLPAVEPISPSDL